jgi:hypothetical protein
MVQLFVKKNTLIANLNIESVTLFLLKYVVVLGAGKCANI